MCIQEALVTVVSVSFSFVVYVFLYLYLLPYLTAVTVDKLVYCITKFNLIFEVDIDMLTRRHKRCRFFFKKCVQLRLKMNLSSSYALIPILF